MNEPEWHEFEGGKVHYINEWNGFSLVIRHEKAMKKEWQGEPFWWIAIEKPRPIRLFDSHRRRRMPSGFAGSLPEAKIAAKTAAESEEE